MQEDIKELKATQDELLAADRYHAKLAPVPAARAMPTPTAAATLRVTARVRAMPPASVPRRYRPFRRLGWFSIATRSASLLGM